MASFTTKKGRNRYGKGNIHNILYRNGYRTNANCAYSII